MLSDTLEFRLVRNTPSQQALVTVHVKDTGISEADCEAVADYLSTMEPYESLGVKVVRVVLR